MKITVVKVLSLFFILSGAGSSIADSTTNDAAATAYPVKGVVESIAPGLRQATIHNERIPGYMDDMTMDFAIRDTNELNGISPGDKITFDLMVTKDDTWIQDLKRIGRTTLAVTNLAQPMPAMSELEPGDELPDEALNSEDGRTIHFSDFRGKALAFTFFFTRCPLPNYCPLMNQNFAAARDLISSMTNAPANWQLLSISFDPANDTSQALTAFGGFYRRGNPEHWLFASAPTNTLAVLAPLLDLSVVHQGSSISHNLRTVVLDTQGRIYRQFDGNQWTPDEFAKAIIAAARQ